MSGVDIAGLVERLRALPTMAGSWVDTVRNEAADALLAQAAELAEVRREVGELKDRLKNSYFESYARELCYRLAAENEAKRATRQRDEALAALKASEERGERLSQELASARLRPEPSARRVRHKKTGGTYQVIAIGKMQSTHWHDHHYRVPADMRSVVIYRAEKDGSIWVRPEAEFEDGRFETITGEAP